MRRLVVGFLRPDVYILVGRLPIHGNRIVSTFKSLAGVRYQVGSSARNRFFPTCATIVYRPDLVILKVLKLYRYSRSTSAATRLVAAFPACQEYYLCRSCSILYAEFCRFLSMSSLIFSRQPAASGVTTERLCRRAGHRFDIEAVRASPFELRGNKARENRLAARCSGHATVAGATGLGTGTGTRSWSAHLTDCHRHRD